MLETKQQQQETVAFIVNAHTDRYNYMRIKEIYIYIYTIYVYALYTAMTLRSFLFFDSLRVTARCVAKTQTHQLLLLGVQI